MCGLTLEEYINSIPYGDTVLLYSIVEDNWIYDDYAEYPYNDQLWIPHTCKELYESYKYRVINRVDAANKVVYFDEEKGKQSALQ